jgi:glucosamine-6-phosphate deaminase
MQEMTYGELPVTILDSAGELGERAAADFASAVRDALKKKEIIAVILATGNSQLPFIDALRKRTEIDWSRLVVFHMDEYIGMGAEHPSSFYRWMSERVDKILHPKEFFGIHGDATSIEEEITRYSELLEKYQPSITVMGIGENGHLAFNDPRADFETKDWLKIVNLDDLACRTQQVNEGHFASLEEMPERAITVTIYGLLRSESVLVLTPESRKAVAVQKALEGPFTDELPASILKTVSNAHLYLDLDSSALLKL